MYSMNPSYYELGSCSSNSVKFHLEGGGGGGGGGVVSSNSTNMANSMSMVRWSSLRSTAEEEEKGVGGGGSKKKSHSEAESRRRKRINGHLATLRTLLPNTIKTDKASLLAEVVRRLRELKKTTTELTQADSTSTTSDNGSGQSGRSAKEHHNMLPSEADELELCYCEEEGDSAAGTIKATMSCEDRPELVSDMTRAVRSVEGKVVRAEMATVGGRTKSVLWVQVSGDSGGSHSDSSGGERLGMLGRALKVVVDRASLSMSGPGQDLPGNKRPRLYHY